MTAARRAVGLASALAVASALALTAACHSDAEKKAARWTGGDAARGRIAIRKFGCSSCHTIPGIPGADALVGPPLDRIAARAYVAGRLNNTPANMMRFIAHPHGTDRGTAMPEMGIPDRDVRDIAAYLYTLD